MRAKKWKSTDSVRDIFEFLRDAAHSEQLTVCHRASPSVFLSATAAIAARQQKLNLFRKPGLVVFLAFL